MQVISTSMEVGTSISSKSTWPPAAPGPPALATALSRSWACVRRCWFRRWPSRRSARMASTWSRLQRHADPHCRPSSFNDTPDPEVRRTLGAWAGSIRVHPAFLEPGLRETENEPGGAVLLEEVAGP